MRAIPCFRSLDQSCELPYCNRHVSPKKSFGGDSRSSSYQTTKRVSSKSDRQKHRRERILVNSSRHVVVWPSQVFPSYATTNGPTSPLLYSAAPQIDLNMAHQCVALDCEMVGVGPGGLRSVLARVSVIDSQGVALFDTFVRVDEKVVDYRTFVSGVRERDLVSPDAISFGECRRRVQKLIAHKVLVGHGLQNDLTVLKLMHPWYNIRDTCLYVPFMQLDHFGMCRPRRLRDLARQHVGMLIQQAGEEHDPIEDARAALLLYKMAQTEWDYMMTWKRRCSMLQAPLHLDRVM
jgi:RNA exonuclease 4